MYHKKNNIEKIEIILMLFFCFYFYTEICIALFSRPAVNAVCNLLIFSRKISSHSVDCFYPKNTWFLWVELRRSCGRKNSEQYRGFIVIRIT